MSTPVMVPVFAPDGSMGEVPQTKLQDAISAGAKPAYAMTSPDGKTGYVPEDRVHDALQAGAKLGGGADVPSNAQLYGQALFNPVGSGAHSQGIIGGAEQVGGRAMQTMLAPVMHPLEAAKGIIQTVAHPDLYDPANPVNQRIMQGAEEYHQSPALTAENAAGDVLGTVEGGRMANAAMSGVKPSGILGPANNALPAAVQRGIVPSALKATANALPASVQTAAGKVIPQFVDGPPESLMTRAVKPGKNNASWLPDVRKGLPLLKSAEADLGHPIEGINDAVDAANIAKKGIWQQYMQRLGPAAAQGATIDGNAVADAMMGSIDKRMALQNPGLTDQIKAIADTYRRPMSLTDAEDFLQSNNKELVGYYAKNKMSQQAAESDPQIAAKVAEGNALRNALYGKLDDLSGPGAAQLKQAYGALTNIQKELTGRQIVYARQAPVNLPEQLSYLQASGKILTGNVVGGLKDIAVQRFMSELNNTDSMIARALKASKPAAPFPAPAFRPPIGPARQLPATSGAPTILPYNPEMTPGEKAAALMQALRQSRAPLALPQQASPIILPPPR